MLEDTLGVNSVSGALFVYQISPSREVTWVQKQSMTTYHSNGVQSV